VFGHAEAPFDVPELVLGADDEVGVAAGQVGAVALPSGQCPGFGLQLAVDALGCAGEFDVAVAFDCRLAVDGVLGFGDLLVDAVQGALGPVGPVLVVDDPVGKAAGLLATG
jgi:hypothetical protein